MRITRWALKNIQQQHHMSKMYEVDIFYLSSAFSHNSCVSVGYRISVYIHNSFSLLPNDVRMKFSLGSFFLQAKCWKVLIENEASVHTREWKNEKIISYWTTVPFLAHPHPIYVSKGKEKKAKIYSWWIEAKFIKRHGEKKRKRDEKRQITITTLTSSRWRQWRFLYYYFQIVSTSRDWNEHKEEEEGSKIKAWWRKLTFIHVVIWKRFC